MAALRDIMTSDVFGVSRDTPVAEAAQTMLANGFRRLPVVEGTEVTGIVSLRDVLSARIRRKT